MPRGIVEHVALKASKERLDMSPFWVILCRLRRSLFALVVICWCIGGAPSAPLRAQAPPAGSPLSIVDEDTRKQIKELKLKVNASIQGESLRVSSSKKDDLQAVIAHLRANPPEIPIQFNNYR